MLMRLCASKQLFSASEMQLQVFYSALDQHYHGANPLGPTGNTTDVLTAVQKQYYTLPYVPNTVSTSPAVTGPAIVSIVSSTTLKIFNP